MAVKNLFAPTGRRIRSNRKPVIRGGGASVSVGSGGGGGGVNVSGLVGTFMSILDRIEYEKEKAGTLKNIHDTDINKILSPYYKIELLNKVKTLVGISSIDEFDKFKFRDANKKVINDMNLLNRISMSYKLKVKPDYKLGQLFGKLLNHMLPKFTNKVRISTNGKQYKGFYIKPLIKELLIKPDPEICFLD